MTTTVRARLRAAAFALLALLVLATPAQAADKLRLERIDLTKSPTMKAYLTLTDGEGRVITGRAREELKLVLDSAEQGAAASLVSFDTSGEPVNLVVCVQVSQAMLDVADDVKKGVKMLANALPPKSRMALLGFSSETKRLVELGAPADAEAAANQLVTDTEYVEVHLLDALRSTPRRRTPASSSSCSPTESTSTWSARPSPRWASAPARRTSSSTPSATRPSSRRGCATSTS
jgi:hypothetical protein